MTHRKAVTLQLELLHDDWRYPTRIVDARIRAKSRMKFLGGAEAA